MEELSINDVNDKALEVLAKEKENEEKDVLNEFKDAETSIDNKEFTFSHKPTPFSKYSIVTQVFNLIPMPSFSSLKN